MYSTPLIYIYLCTLYMLRSSVSDDWAERHQSVQFMFWSSAELNVPCLRGIIQRLRHRVQKADCKAKGKEMSQSESDLKPTDIRFIGQQSDAVSVCARVR
jgi:hypothetical protein